LGRKLLTVQDNGESAWLATIVKTMVAEQQLYTTAQQVLRGQIGRVFKGAVAGGLSYGYAPVKGEPGKRVIVPERAEVVRRIYSEFAAGRSAYQIAVGLNKDGIPAPGGTHWSTSTIVGSRQRGAGILANPNYVGRIEFNKLKDSKNPSTGKRVSRLKSLEDRRVVEVPELTIVPRDLWDEVQRLRNLARPGRMRD
jgi:site-specific DNA recombinase